jgi:hypothetical protein
MDAARVFVWRVRFFLLAAAVGLVGVGADRPSPVPQAMQRYQPTPAVPAVATVAAFAPKAVPVQISSNPVSRSVSQPLKQARSRVVVVHRPPELRCSGRATNSASRGQKSTSCKVMAARSSPTFKATIAGQRKPIASASKKRDLSPGPTRNAEFPKARQKVARKGDTRTADNVAAVRQTRTGKNA